MSNGMGLPPDIQEQVNKQEPRRPTAVSPGGIGGRAKGNASTAHQREVAMGRGHDEAIPQPEEEQVDDVQDESELTCPNTLCGVEVQAKWKFCSGCGADILAGNPAKRLGISFTEEDTEDYIFKGYVVRDIPVLRRYTATMRTSQARDLLEVDDFLVNGDWLKDDKGEMKQVSEFLIRQMNAMCVTAMAVQKINGQSIGEDLPSRVEWLQEKGSAFVDILAQKVTLYNRAITDHLKSEDALLGS